MPEIVRNAERSMKMLIKIVTDEDDIVYLNPSHIVYVTEIPNRTEIKLDTGEHIKTMASLETIVRKVNNGIHQ